MTTSAPLSGTRQDTKSSSGESSSSVNDLSCGTRKAAVAAELDSKKMCRINSKNLNSHNAFEPHKVSVQFFTEQPKQKGSPARREPEKRPRSTNTTYVVANINRINSSSNSKEELVQDRLRKRKASGNPEPPEKRKRVSESESGSNISYSDPHTSKPDFEGKYKQLGLIGKGGYGSVYAGLRLADSLPVAIKYADGWRAQRELKVGCVPLEVVLMQTAGGGPESVGKFAAVALLDWYCLDQKLVLVMERPPISLDLAQYVDSQGGRLQEAEARALMNQLVDAAMEMYHKGVFHRDLKLENTLVEIGSPGPRLRIIDFGCGSYVQKNFSRYFHGTLPFAPPEWFKYEKYKPVSTTVWQLGAMLYRMLHSYPFDTRLFTIGQIKFSINLSQECLDFLGVCLEEKPKKRATLEQLRAHAWLN